MKFVTRWTSSMLVFLLALPIAAQTPSFRMAPDWPRMEREGVRMLALFKCAIFTREGRLENAEPSEFIDLARESGQVYFESYNRMVVGESIMGKGPYVYNDVPRGENIEFQIGASYGLIHDLVDYEIRNEVDDWLNFDERRRVALDLFYQQNCLALL